MDRKYLGEVVDTISTDLWNVEFVENNNRLFILGEVAPEPGPDDNANGWVGDKKLYVVNHKDKFVEIASCEASQD